jgi:hypothetical protein
MTIKIDSKIVPKVVLKNLHDQCSHMVGTGKYWATINDELNKFGAKYDHSKSCFHFNDEAMYHWFLLRWS